VAAAERAAAERAAAEKAAEEKEAARKEALGKKVITGPPGRARPAKPKSEVLDPHSNSQWSRSTSRATPNPGLALYHNNMLQRRNGSQPRSGGSNLKRTRKKKVRN
jgi:hypothetical protein